MKKSTRWPLPVLACALALLLPALGAAIPAWVQVSPFGGALLAIGRSPSSPRIVYVSDSRGIVFRSDDAAVTWHRVELPQGGRITDFLVDAGNPLTVFALIGRGRLARTRDGGQTWSPIGVELPNVIALTAEAHSPDRLLAATSHGLFRSPDGGDHWARVAFGGFPVLAVASDPFLEGNLLAILGAYPQTAWRSIDHGLTWTAVSLAIEPFGHSEDKPHFVFDAARSGTVYAYFDLLGEDYPGPIFRSTDGGSTWVQPSTTDVRDLVSTADGTLFAASDFGVLRSVDRGDTWQSTGSAPQTPRDEIFHLAASSAHPEAVLATGTLGLWKSVDGGAHWRESNRGIPVPYAADVAVAPIGPRDVLSLAGGRVFRSSDRGTTWQPIHSRYDAREPYTIQFDPRTIGSAYGFGDDGQAGLVLHTADLGHTWIRLPIPYNCEGQGSICEVGIGAFALDPSHSETLYVTGSYYFHFSGGGSFFLRSRDGGATWKNLRNLDPLLSGLFVDPRRSTVLYGLTLERLYKSEDGARTWTIVGRGLPPRADRPSRSIPAIPYGSTPEPAEASSPAPTAA
ncbi:MAG: hypothetical protein ABJC13_00205 [Acidobacteriota bacterium]